MGRDWVGTPALREEEATKLRAGGLCANPQSWRRGLTGKWNVQLTADFAVITFLMLLVYFPVRIIQDFKS